MTTFSHLLQQIRSCSICQPHLPLGPRPVFQASPQAKILVVGQAPGRRVHLTGLPFNDPSGDRLRDWMGINRDTFYNPELLALVPMGFCYPGTGQHGDLPPRPECAASWRHPLMHYLKNIRLTLLVGSYAQKYYLEQYLGKRYISVSATSQDYQQLLPQYIPLPHPSPRNNLWLRRNPWFEENLIPVLQKEVRGILPSIARPVSLGK